MLLNSFAQPTLLTTQNTHLNLKEFEKAPLLLCHKNALERKLLPQDWSGSIYGTEEILNAVKEKKYKMNLTNCHALKPNEIYNISIGNDDFQGKVKQIELTMIPWDKEYVMYLIKTDNVINLLTDLISENMEVFVQNKILRNSIKTGIDILYINDGVYSNSSVFKEYPTECLLEALATLVRPRYIQGLTNYEQLPEYLLNCCLDSTIS